MTRNPEKRFKHHLISDYRRIRKTSEDICDPLQTEDYVVQPALDASPPKWHLGHTTWFFENFILKEHAEGYQAFDERLDFLFNSYYESQGPRILRSHRGNMSRPDVHTVYQYRAHVDKALVAWLESPSTMLDEDLEQLLIVGLNHEQQHQELLLTDIKYILGHNPLFPPYKEIENKKASYFPMNFLSVKAGSYQIGYQGDGFCWDNELACHEVLLEDFEIADRLVTCGEYLEFMESGAYEDYSLWLSEGWEWVKSLDVKAPEYWFSHKGQWLEYRLDGLKEVDPNSPLTHISYFEADAFARWKGMRLPTEFEWEAACRSFQKGIPDTGFFSPVIVHPRAKADAIDPQFLGQCWEWTSSAYQPYPRYPRFKGALGEYNGKFMVNQMVLRGGSIATPADHIRTSYRNFFHADKRWQFTGIRLTK